MGRPFFLTKSQIYVIIEVTKKHNESSDFNA